MRDSPQNLEDRFPSRGYGRIIETLRVVAGSVVLEIARTDDSLKHKIICDFVARVISSLLSIERLWELGHFEDCWILNRTILQRLFLLSHLRESDEFKEFEEWSFVKQAKALHKLATDQEFRQKVEADDLVFEAEQWARFLELNQKGISWKEPRPEDVAKKMKMSFLYHYGYDYASRFIHPFAGDGRDAVHRLIQKDWIPTPRHSVVVKNSILAVTMVFQEALNASDLRWRPILFDFLDQVRESVEDASQDYGLSFLKIAQLFQERQLSEAIGSTPASGD